MFIDWSADEGLKKNLQRIFSFGINRSFSQTNFTVSVHDVLSIQHESHSARLRYLYSFDHRLTTCLQHLCAIAALLKDSKRHPAPTGWLNLFAFLPQYVSVILGSAAFCLATPLLLARCSRPVSFSLCLAPGVSLRARQSQSVVRLWERQTDCVNCQRHTSIIHACEIPGGSLWHLCTYARTSASAHAGEKRCKNTPRAGKQL